MYEMETETGNCQVVPTVELVHHGGNPQTAKFFSFPNQVTGDISQPPGIQMRFCNSLVKRRWVFLYSLTF